ncbi:MAG TPA: carbohydrate-binding family 9-like protein [Polyangiaceae bacterium]|nr:carbohydrate-binding family 9-like protein [Polyangiaceae bacterium]
MMSRKRSFLVLSGAVLSLVSSLTLVGCSSCSREEKKVDLTQFVMDAAPGDITKLEVDFDGKVKLLGYKWNEKRGMRPGRPVDITLYWQPTQKLEDNAHLYVHLLDESGERIAVLDEDSPIRELRDGKPALPPSSWQPGKVYADELSFKVPRRVKTSNVQLVAGVQRGEERVKPTGGQNVDGSALIVTAGTGVKARTPQAESVAEMRVDRLPAKTKLNIDGKLDEEAWKEAPSAPFSALSREQRRKKMGVDGSIHVLWDNDGMYLGFDVKDRNVTGGFSTDDKSPQLWKKDAVEVILDPEAEGDSKDYYEILVNPQNLVFDTVYDDSSVPADGPYGHEDWSAGVKSAVTVHGTLDNDQDQDEGYVVEMFLPWKSFSKAKKTPPVLGDTWRMNFYAINERDLVGWQSYPTLRGPLQTSWFGRVTWAEKGFQIQAATAPSASSAAPAASGSAASAPAPSGAGKAANAPVKPAMAPAPVGATPAAPKAATPKADVPK